VTKFTSPRKIEYGIGVSYNGYVWFAQQEDRAASFEKDIAVFELPRDLRESTYQYKIADLRSQCVDLDDFNTTLMADPSEFVRVVSNALNLSGLQYFYPNRSGSYIDLHLFNLTKVSDPSSGLSVALDQSVTPVTPILLDPTEKAGFHFDLWNAVIYHGLMEFCEVFIPTPLWWNREISPCFRVPFVFIADSVGLCSLWVYCLWNWGASRAIRVSSGL